MMVVELEDKAGAVGKSLQGCEYTGEVDIALSQPQMSVVTAVVVLQVDVLEQIAVLANPLGDAGATTRHRDAHMTHVDAVAYPRLVKRRNQTPQMLGVLVLNGFDDQQTADFGSFGDDRRHDVVGNFDGAGKCFGLNRTKW